MRLLVLLEIGHLPSCSSVLNVRARAYNLIHFSTLTRFEIFPSKLPSWGQMEVPLGIIPGGGACVNLGRFVGVARTMEVGHLLVKAWYTSVLGELKLTILGIYPSDNPFYWLTIYHMFLHVDLSVGFWLTSYSNIFMPNMYDSVERSFSQLLVTPKMSTKPLQLVFLVLRILKTFCPEILQVVLSGDDIEADQAERWGNLMWTSLELLKGVDRIQLVATRWKDRPP